jgi:3-isopropylmalate/(R)-2-methylmalate dehydratase small subunit
MIPKLKGKAHILGNDITIDIILPETESADGDSGGSHRHSAKGDRAIVAQIGAGDILLAGANFGICHDACPNTHLEKAVAYLKDIKLGCIVAGSFSRMFYRAAINGGLPVIESKEAFRLVKPKEEIEIDLLKGEICHKAGVVNGAPLPEPLWRIVESGGLVAYVKRAVVR